jgi:hypothetical protein
MTKDIIDRIFKEPGVRYELTEFEGLGKPIHEIIAIYPKTAEMGRDAGKTKYFLESIVSFASDKKEVQVLAEGGKSIHFGTGVGTKVAADGKRYKTSSISRNSWAVAPKTSKPKSPAWNPGR